MLMLGFWANRSVPIKKFKISYPDGKVLYPQFRKFQQSDGSVIFKFKEPVAFHNGCNLSWISHTSFEAKVSPIFQAENEIDRKLLEIDSDYQLRLLEYKRLVE